MIKKYIKTTPVEALQSTKDNRKEIRNFADGYRINFETSGNSIFTLEGKMRFNYGDYLVKNQSGECYVCRKDIFEKTYKEIERIKNEEKNEHKRYVNSWYYCLYDKK